MRTALEAQKTDKGGYLAEPGVIESLIKEGRLPWVSVSFPHKEIPITIYGIKTTKTVLDEDNPAYTCIVPPKGTQPGDHFTMSALHGFVFHRPDGTFVGEAEFITITPQQAKDIKERIKKISP